MRHREGDSYEIDAKSRGIRTLEMIWIQVLDFPRQPAPQVPDKEYFVCHLPG